MKRFFTKKIILVGGGLGVLITLTLCLFLDAYYESNFRTMQDTLWTTRAVNVTGLRELRASGSTSVRFPDLMRRLRHITGSKIVVDGMAEFHGYIKGIPSTFFAYQREAPSMKHLIRRFIYTGTTDMRSDLVTPEDQEALKYGLGYKRVNIGSSFIETDENIDQIIDFYDTLPPEAWLHFHCAHGKGRTSILLVMLDIMKNAPVVSLQDIVERQILLGSENLLNTEAWKNGTYNEQKLKARKKFVENFYAFVCQRKAGGPHHWSAWRRQQK